MSRNISIADALALAVEERLCLVEDIFDSIAAIPETIVVSDSQRKELDERLEAHRRNPTEGSVWSEVRDRLARRQ